MPAVVGQSRRAQVNAAGEEVVTPGCFTRSVMKRPCVVMWVTFVAAIFLSALPLASGAIAFQLTGAAGTDNDSIQEMRDHYTWIKIGDSDDKYEATSMAAESGSGDTVGNKGMDLSTFMYYEGLTGSNMFTKVAIEAQTEYETALLDLTGWSTRCKTATSTFNASDTRCASPQTVLRHLRTNDALEKEQCEAGFCAGLNFGVSLQQCEALGYGVFPCVSTVYDWRDGTLAPEADWPSLLASKVCENTGMPAWSQLCGGGAARCSSRGHLPPQRPSRLPARGCLLGPQLGHQRTALVPAQRRSFHRH